MDRPPPPAAKKGRAPKPRGHAAAPQRLTATLDGFPEWALRQYQHETQETEKAALSYIIKRWTELDRIAADKAKCTLEHYRSAQGGGSVVAFRKSGDK